MRERSTKLCTRAGKTVEAQGQETAVAGDCQNNYGMPYGKGSVRLLYCHKRQLTARTIGVMEYVANKVQKKRKNEK